MKKVKTRAVAKKRQYSHKHQTTLTIKPIGEITDKLEPILEELCDAHQMQAHEILGIVLAWCTCHRPHSIEVYVDDGSHPRLKGIKYGPN